MLTKIIDNFNGVLTRNNYGDLNSGYVKLQTSFGYDPFVKPGQLSWCEAPVQIDPTYSVLTDLIMDGKERVESGIVYLYCLQHLFLRRG